MLRADPGGDRPLTPDLLLRADAGQSNARLRAHLALVVEQNNDDNDDGPRMTIANRTYAWREGACAVFDDSFEHSVAHRGATPRIVLVVDVRHPDLLQ